MASPSAASVRNPRGGLQLVADADHLETVVRQGMLSAQTSVDIMTADLKAMLVPDGTRRGRRENAPSILTHLAKLAGRGVEVRILHAGVPSRAALEELKKHQGAALLVRRCPRLHSKAVVVDARWVYLGSANLTGAGLGAKGPTRRNFEMGLCGRSSELVDEVLARFNALWEGEHCEGCGRRDVCPEPLESPDL